jgi:Raf kinase inhibitor-like YbhB/YbcL family protein
VSTRPELVPSSGEGETPETSATANLDAESTVPPTAAESSEVSSQEVAETSPSLTEEPQPLEIQSGAFGAGEMIPEKYSCEGENVSPALSWDEPPIGTQSFTLFFDDPDAVEVVGYTWVHWTIFNLPAEVRALPEAIPAEEQLPVGGLHGENSWKRVGYGGPCPPSGTHLYSFRLYALDTMLDVEAGATFDEIQTAMQGHILAQAELKGAFTR